MGFGKWIFGTRSNDILAGSAGNDFILGLKGDDQIEGGAGKDKLFGGSGDDQIDGGAGNDLLSGGKGDDILQGGSGSDLLLGGRGEDRLVFVAEDNVGSYDYYNGGRDTDTLELVLTAAEANDPAIQADIAAFQAHLAGIQSGSIRAHKAFTFSSLGLTVKNIEQLVITQTGNQAPVAVDDAATTNEDTAVTVSLLGNDNDPDGDTLTVTAVTQGTNGSVVLNPDGTATYTPNANFNGSDSFSYTIGDGNGGTATATATVTVAPVNDAPVAVDDAATTNEDTAVTVTLLGNDTDPDGDTLTVTAVTQGANGSVVLNPDGTATYTPNANFNGSDSFSYTISDGNGGTATATASVTVAPVNDAPLAVDDAATTNEDTAVIVTLLGNDSDPDGDTLTVTAVTQGANGSVVLNLDGTATYTPNANFNGSDSFSYTISDGNGGTATATATVTVAPVNDAPVAVDDIATTNEDTAVIVTLLGNDSDPDGDTLTVTAVTQGANGAVVLNLDGTATYTPNANFNGTDTFSYTISDGNGGTATATATVTIGAVNDAPVAVDDAATTNEDTAVTVTLLGNDSDPDGDTLTVTAVTQGANGAVVLNLDGTATYTPNANFNGTDTFSYTISDGNGGTATATATVTVAPVNDAPVAVDDIATTNEDTAVIVTLLGNDSDPDGDTLTVTAVTQGTNGAVVLNLDGTATYAPNANFNGTDTFSYTISDGNGGTATATATVTIGAVNDAPVAVEDAATTNEDTAVTITLLGNDSDPDGDTLTVTAVTQGANGSVVLNLDGTATYTPNANFNGSDSFSYTISDGNGGTATATATVTVAPVNDAPVAVDDGATTNEDTAVTVTLLGNDSDPDGDTLTVTAVTQGANGTVVLNVDGTATYTPNANFNGSDSFSYTISDGNGGTATATASVTVGPVNDTPLAVDDATATNEDTAVTVTLLGNDSDPDGDTLTVTAVTQGANGTVVLNLDGTATYTPNANFNGTDTFSYTISDGNGGTATATATVTVGAVNDAPVAVDDAATTNEDTVVTVTLLGNDSDPDGDTLTVTAVTQGANGSVVLNLDGTATYTPNANFNGSDSFSYTISDGNGGTATATATVTIGAVNDAPVAVDDAATTNEDTAVIVTLLGNDSDPDGDTLTVTAVTQGANGTVVLNPDGTASYTPNANFNGTDTFSYTISDGNGGTATATATVTIGAVNDVPVAVDDVATTNEDTAVTVTLLGNDSDPDGDTLTVTAVTQGANGTVVLNMDGTATYTPNANFNGSDSFSYTISDGNGGTATATASVTVAPVNDAPVTVDDVATTNEDTAVTVTLLGNDSDPDGDTLTVTAVTQGTNGAVVLNPDGTATYTPNANFNGSDSFSYTISDGNGGTATATASVTVAPVNDAPLAVDDAATTNEDTAVIVTLLGNDSDPDGDTLTVTAVTQGANGTVVLNMDGTATYTPNANFNGSDSFSYTISDGNGGTATATASVTVAPVNDAPVTVDDVATTNEDTAVTVTLLGNDSDPDGDTLTVTAVTQGTNGTVVLNLDGTATYTPNANFNGSDSFSYTISDGNGGTATATATVTVGAVNDAPVAVDDISTTNEDTAVIVTLLGNDSDPDGDTLTVTSVTQGTNGAVVLNLDGTATYAPNANFNGTDTFSYTISDGNGGTATATATVTVAPVNDAPVAVDDAATTNEDTAVTVTLLGNDSDPDGDTLTVTAVTQGVNGSVVLNPDGTATYTPNANFNGTDTFSYTISDGNGGTATATVNVTVGAVNDPPDAVDDTIGNGTVSEFLVNELTNNAQFEPSITALSNGDFVVTWVSGDPQQGDTSNNGVKARIFDATGNQIVNEFLVNELTNSAQTQPNTTALSNGGFVVTWTSQDPQQGDTSSFGVKARIFDATGNEVVSEFLVNEITNNFQIQPSITALSNGGFVVTWTSGDLQDDTSSFSVKARIFDAAGNEVANEFLVNELTNNNQHEPSIAALANGGFIITWRSNDPQQGDTSSNGIKARIFDATGNEVVSEFLVNEITDNSQIQPSVTALSSGGFVVTWTSSDLQDDTSSFGVKARIFDAAGNEVVSEFLVNEFTNINQTQSSITALSNGGFVVAWTSQDPQQGDTSSAGIKARVFDAAGNDVVSEFLVNEFANDNQVEPSITALSNGGFVVTWRSDDPQQGDTSGSGIKARIFDANGVPQNVGEVTEDGVTTIQPSALLANDSDPDGDAIIISAVSGTSTEGATVTLSGDGTIGYDPTASATLDALAAGETGNDTFTYTISDGNGGTDTADVTVIVTGVNDAPTLAGGAVAAVEDGPAVGVDLAVLGADVDSDDDGTSLTYAIVTGPAEGSASIAGTTLTFDPGTAFQDLAVSETRDVMVQVQATDSHGAVSGTTDITVTITGTNDVPVVTAIDAGTVGEDDPAVTIDLLNGQIDPDTSDVLSAVTITATDSGGNPVTFTDNGDGTILIDPGQFDALNNGESETVTVSYGVSDGIAITPNTATLVIDGSTDNLPPDAVDDAIGNATVSEFLVNEFTNDNQVSPSITALSNGGFVVTWHSNDPQQGDTSGSGIKARIFDAAGNEVVSEFLVNQLTNGGQSLPSITALSNGGFVVTWTSNDPQQGDTSLSGIKARIFDAAGNEVVSEFLVNEFTNSGQNEPSITALSNGGFVVTWQSFDGQQGDTSLSGIKARIFDANGNEVVSEFLVNEFTNDFQLNPSITALSNGGFVVTWHSDDPQQGDTSSLGVKARIFDEAGNEVVSEFLVNEFANDDQFEPSITALSNGGFVVTWTSNDLQQSDLSGSGIKARIFDAAGSEVVSEFLVNEFTNDNQVEPSITALSNGGFVVTWRSNDPQQGDTSSSGIKARIFDAAGNEVVSEFLVNEFTNSAQFTPSITALSNGGFVVTWRSQDPQQGDTSGSGIKARIFDANGMPQTVGEITEDAVSIIQPIALLANDSDPENDIFTITAVSGASTEGATVTLNGDGTIGYDPTASATLDALAAGETAIDTFTYTISDGNGGTDTATVNVTVAGVNDAPLAVDSLGTTNEDLALIGQLTGTDVDTNDTLTFALDGGAANGTVTVQSDGSYVYTPNAGFAGTDSFTFNVSDGTAASVQGSVTINVAEVAGRQVRFLEDITTDDQVSTDVSTTKFGPEVTALDDGGHIVVWSSLNQDGSDWGVFGQRYDASGNAVGSELQINTTTASFQLRPSAAGLTGGDLDGGFIVVWEGAGPGDSFGIFGQRYDSAGNAVGSEFLINANTAGSQRFPTVTSLADSQFAVVWEDQSSVDGDLGGVILRVFDAEGPLDPPTALTGEIVVNETTSGNQQTEQFRAETIATLDDGGFVVSWRGPGSIGNDDAFIRVFDADGTARTGEIQVNTAATGIADAQGFVSVGALEGIDAGFVVTWTDAGNAGSGDGNDYGIFARRFDKDGMPQGDDFLVNSFTTGRQQFSKVAGLADGGFVILWESQGVDGSSNATISGQRYDASGNAVNGEFIVPNVSLGLEELPSVTLRADGALIAAWEADNTRIEQKIIPGFATDEQVSTNTVNSKDNPEVAALSGGGHVVVWSSHGQVPDGSDFGVFAQRYDAQGDAVGSEFLVNTFVPGQQFDPSVAGITGGSLDGGFVVVWQSFGQNSPSDVFAQRYDASGNAVGGEFQVNVSASSFQEQPTVSSLANGQFAVTWTDFGGADGSFEGVFLRMFDAATGAATTGEIQVNQTGLGSQRNDGYRSETITTLDDGGFVVSWASGTGLFSDANAPFDAYFRVFNADGTARTVEVQTNSATTAISGNQSLVSVGALQGVNAGFVVTWTDLSGADGDGAGIFARVYDQNGNALAADFQVSSVISADQESSKVVGLDDGGFVITWQSFGADLVSNKQTIAGQRYDASGNAVDGEFIIPDNAFSDDAEPSIALREDGALVAVWQSDSLTIEQKIITDLSSGAEAKTLTGGPGSDSFIGGDLADTIDGAGGDDRIEGLGGDDLLTGGTGADVFVFDNGAGNDTILDFEVGSDGIELQGGVTITNMSEVDTTGDTNVDSTLVELSDGSEVVLENVLGGLTAGDILA